LLSNFFSVKISGWVYDVGPSDNSDTSIISFFWLFNFDFTGSCSFLAFGETFITFYGPHATLFLLFDGDFEVLAFLAVGLFFSIINFEKIWIASLKLVLKVLKKAVWLSFLGRFFKLKSFLTFDLRIIDFGWFVVGFLRLRNFCFCYLDWFVIGSCRGWSDIFINLWYSSRRIISLNLRASSFRIRVYLYLRNRFSLTI